MIILFLKDGCGISKEGGLVGFRELFWQFKLKCTVVPITEIFGRDRVKANH